MYSFRNKLIARQSYRQTLIQGRRVEVVIMSGSLSVDICQVYFRAHRYFFEQES